MGPDHRSLIGSFKTHQDWQNSLDDYYSKPPDLEVLRWKSEAYVSRLIGYTEENVARIQYIQSSRTVAWSRARGSTNESPASRNTAQLENFQDTAGTLDPEQSNDPRICLGTHGLIALVPSAARAGDVMVQFRGCSAAVIMRCLDAGISQGSASPLMLVGRADVAGAHERRKPSEDNAHAQHGAATDRNLEPEDIEARHVVDMKLDLGTLQTISASIATF